MKPKIIILCVLIGLLLLLGALFYFKILKPNHYATGRLENPEQNYDKKVTTKDSEPIKIPEEALKSGRTVVIPILMYHHIGDLPKNADKVRIGLTVSTVNFEAQTKWLKDNGYASISLQNLYDYSKGNFTLPKKPVIFTFDDGYDDVFTNAVPVLDTYGFKGSFAIITQNPGQTQGDNVYASWDEILKAYRDGHEIVSHTQDHFDGSSPKFSKEFITKNLKGSLEDLQTHLGITTNILIYPYGHYTTQYIKAAKENGFVMGVTVHEGDRINLDNLMEVPRIRVYNDETIQRFEEIILHKSLKPSTTPESLYGK